MISILIATINRKNYLFQLLDSIYSHPPKEAFEVIVVDDHSEELIEQELHQKYPTVIYSRHDSRMGLIKTRNDGWHMASGEIVAFIDDDNDIRLFGFFDKAVSILEKDTSIGILGCRTYYFDNPEIVQFGPTIFNKLTGKTTFLNTNKPDLPELNGLIPSHDVPNAFFTRKSLLEKTGGFTEEIIQTFSEADLAEKIRKLGYKVYHCSELKIYHRSPLMDTKKLTLKHMGGSAWRFYYLMRNRFVFERKYATKMQLWLFTLIFSHIYSLYYFYHLIRLQEWKVLYSGFRGIVDGYIYVFTGKLNNFYFGKEK